MHKELIPTIEKLEQAVVNKDAQEIIAILNKLKETFIYSGNEVYDRFYQIKHDLIAVLFESLELTEFCQLFVDDSFNQKIYGSDLYKALEKRVEHISFKALWTMKDYFGFPSHFWCPKLFAILSDEPDKTISEELIETIERFATHESEKGTDYSEHQAAQSAFRFIRWAPDDGGLSKCVRLLGSRNDDIARDACKRYLTELPWGKDRGATTALLDGIAKRKTIENETLLKYALSVHQEPLILRQWIWRALFYINPTDALLGAIDDLSRLKKSEDLYLMVDFLGNLLGNLRQTKKDFDVERVVAAAESVNTTRWSFIVRGFYGTMLRNVLPMADYLKVSGKYGRGFVAVARFGNMIQIDHVGCLFPLLVMMGTAALFLFGLDFIMGRPKPEHAGHLFVLFCVWIGWAIINVRTHFSGQKTLVQQFIYVIIYFGLLISAIVMSFVCRL